MKVLIIVITILIFPSSNIENSYATFDSTSIYQELLVKLKYQEEVNKLKVQTRKAMYLAINKNKEKKRIKKCQSLTLLAKTKQ